MEVVYQIYRGCLKIFFDSTGAKNIYLIRGGRKKYHLGQCGNQGTPKNKKL
jgi:hypothetical protein